MGRRKDNEDKEKMIGWLTPRNKQERRLRQTLNILAQVRRKKTRDLIYEAIGEYIERHKQEIKF